MCAISLPTDGSEDEKIHCFQKEGPLSNEREEFTERAAAFYAALGQGAPREKLSRLDKLRTDLKECEIIHQPQNDENFISLINAGPQLNAGFK